MIFFTCLSNFFLIYNLLVIIFNAGFQKPGFRPNQQAPGEGFEPPRADAQTLSCIRFRGVRLNQAWLSRHENFTKRPNIVNR